MATVVFVLAAGVLVAAVVAGAFLVARAIAEPAVEVTAAVLRRRETRREKRNV
jgi:type IV secretory pathway VirB3-like protein